MASPRSVDISVTGRCNLKCGYCFYADEMTELADLPTERWLSFFEELGALAVQTVCLSGGEAFTRPDLFELIDGIIDNRMRYSMLSNGTLISEKNHRSLLKGETPPEAGLHTGQHRRVMRRDTQQKPAAG